MNRSRSKGAAERERGFEYPTWRFMTVYLRLFGQMDKQLYGAVGVELTENVQYDAAAAGHSDRLLFRCANGQRISDIWY